MKKIFILIALAIICAALLAGCSSAELFENTSRNYSGESGGNYAPQRPLQDSYDYDYGYDGYDYEYANEMEADGGSSFALTSSGSAQPAQRKIIRDANITMEVEDVDQSYENILANLVSLGGYEASRNMRGNSGGNSPVVSATLKVPAAQLDNFLEDLKKQGEIISSNISSEDITDQYFDSQIKLTTLEKTLDNYYRFLEEANDMDEQLRITRFINDVTREIESLKGSLRRWDSLVDYSTLVLYLYRPYEAPVPVREINWNSLSAGDMGWFISSGFLGVVNFIFSALQWIFIAIAVMSPIIIPVAVLVFFLVRRHKKNLEKYKKQYANQAANQAANQTTVNN